MGFFFARTLFFGFIPNHFIVLGKVCREFTFEPRGFLRTELAALFLGVCIFCLGL